MRRFNVPHTLGSTIPMGLVALGILALAEIAGVLWVRGLFLENYLTSFLTTPGFISAAMFLLFAATPTFVVAVRSVRNQAPGIIAERLLHGPGFRFLNSERHKPPSPDDRIGSPSGAQRALIIVNRLIR